MVFPTPEDIWNRFLDSADFKKVNLYYRDSLSPLIPRKKTTIKVTRPLPSKKCWHRSLTRACELWKMLRECAETEQEGQLVHVHGSTYHDGIMIMGKSYAEELKEPMWKTLSFLMKGTYYVKHGLSLNRLQEEDLNQFLLHAAIGSLPFCESSSLRRLETNRYPIAVFGEVLKLHGSDQIKQIGPVCDHIPLHVAAANSGAYLQGSKRFKEGPIVKQDRNIAGYMLTKILEASPPSAATALDSNRLNPLQLACLNGHLWGRDLEQLAQKSTTESICSAGILLAVGTSRVKETSWWRNPAKTGRDGYRACTRGRYECGDYNTTDEGHQESLNDVYNLLRSDPSFLAHAVRDIK